MWPAGCSLRTPAKRNLKAPIKLIKQAINSCEQCKGTHTFKSIITPRLTNAFVPNQVLQIDFIGPLQVPFADKYACTIVDTATGILYAYPSRHPNAKTTIQALSTWFSFYGPLHIFESDQGTHFTASSVQQQAQDLDIDWNLHLPYNPQAAGQIERHNGLLKHKLQTLFMDRSFKTLQELLDKACLQLNSTPRANRLSPIEELLQPHILNNPIADHEPPLNITKKLPYKTLTKPAKDGSLSPQEIIAHSGSSLFWTVNSLGHLQQTKLQNSTLWQDPTAHPQTYILISTHSSHSPSQSFPH